MVEALASIAAVSRLTLTSSQDESGIGHQVEVNGTAFDHQQVQAVAAQGHPYSSSGLVF